MIFESSEDQWRTGGILSGDSWKEERVVEVSQKLSISKLHIENKNRACYSTNTQMQSNICNVSIFINSFTSSPDIRKDKQFFFTGIISVQERRTAYEPKKIIKRIKLAGQISVR